MDTGIVFGELNLAGYLHVIFEKTSNPGTPVFETYIPVPFTNHVMMANGLDYENHYMFLYEAATNAELGQFKAKCFVQKGANGNALELRFYVRGSGAALVAPAGATLSPDETTINDPYLVGKDVFLVDKQGDRILNPQGEMLFTTSQGDLELQGGRVLSTDETLVVIINNKTSLPTLNVGTGLYADVLTVTEATKSLGIADVNKRVRCKGALTTQIFTIDLLSAFTYGQGYYFDNSCGGAAIQPKILFSGTNKLNFNGFAIPSNDISEIWLGRGDHFRIEKVDNGGTDVWEITTDYKGTNVGERFNGTWHQHPGTIPEDGRLLDGDEYPRLWWWINNVLPGTLKVFDNNVISPTYVFTASKPGIFVLHNTQKKFRVPKVMGLSERYLTNFTVWGGDAANRPYDYPGGFQNEMVGPHNHTFNTGDAPGDSDDADDRTVMLPNNPGTLRATANNNGTEQRLKNTGVIALRRY